MGSTTIRMVRVANINPILQRSYSTNIWYGWTTSVRSCRLLLGTSAQLQINDTGKINLKAEVFGTFQVPDVE